jgi:hypothetical protein
MSKLLFLLTMIGFGGIVGCTPKLYTMDKNLVLKEAFTQKEIPGQQGGTTFDYLKINFENAVAQSVNMDSIVFRGVTTPFNVSSNRMRLRLNANHAKNQNANGNEEAILYFSKEGQAFKKIIKNINPKSPLYLP